MPGEGAHARRGGARPISQHGHKEPTRREERDTRGPGEPGAEPPQRDRECHEINQKIVTCK